MKEIDKLFAEGVTLEQIQKAYTEAQERDIARQKKKESIEKAREKFLSETFRYLKTIGLDFAGENYTEMKNDMVNNLKEYEKIVAQLLNEDKITYKGKKTKENKRKRDAEIDEILNKIFEDLF